MKQSKLKGSQLIGNFVKFNKKSYRIVYQARVVGVACCDVIYNNKIEINFKF